jgi:hypothetical protein
VTVLCTLSLAKGTQTTATRKKKRKKKKGAEFNGT